MTWRLAPTSGCDRWASPRPHLHRTLAGGDVVAEPADVEENATSNADREPTLW